MILYLSEFVNKDELNEKILTLFVSLAMFKAYL